MVPCCRREGLFPAGIFPSQFNPDISGFFDVKIVVQTNTTNKKTSKNKKTTDIRLINPKVLSCLCQLLQRVGLKSCIDLLKKSIRGSQIIWQKFESYGNVNKITSCLSRDAEKRRILIPILFILPAICLNVVSWSDFGSRTYLYDSDFENNLTEIWLRLLQCNKLAGLNPATYSSLSEQIPVYAIFFPLSTKKTWLKRLY